MLQDTAIDTLTPNLNRIAHKIAATCEGYEPDDAYQDMALALLEKQAEMPDFCEQKPAYVYNFCAWQAKHKAESGRTYTKYIQPETYTETDDGESESEFDIIPDWDLTPEDAFIQNEQLGFIDTLSPENRRIVVLLFIGYSKTEIASMLRISKSALSQRLITIRKSQEGR